MDEGLISETLIDMYSKQGIIAEPAGAASIAALEVMKDDIKGKTIVCIILEGTMTLIVCKKWKNVHLFMTVSNTTL
mgnify:CR=1 FL=1